MIGFFTRAQCDTIILPNSEKKLVKPSELDIYYEPEVQLPSQRIPSPLFLYENVSAARKKVTGAFAGLLTTHEKVYGFFNSLENRVKVLYQDTINDPYYLLTPGAISLAVIGGAAVAGRGRRPIKRSFYALTFGLTATAVSYPHRSLEIVETGYYHTTEALTSLVEQWKSKGENVTEKASKLVSMEPIASNEEETVVNGENEAVDASNPIVQSVTETPEAVPLVENPECTHPTTASTTSQDQETLKLEQHEIIKVGSPDDTAADNADMKIEGDYGQSNADDADMYSTRS